MAGRVLCADADPRVCERVRDTLQRQGYAVETVSDGRSAAAAIAGEAFDLALLEVGLPSGDGLALLEEIRSQRSPVCDIPVFLLAPGRLTPSQHERARAGGATALVHKPAALSKLAALARKYVKEGPPRVETRGRVPIPSQSSPVSGDLRKLDFASLLHHLYGLRATGVLVLTNSGRRKVVQLREGYPVAVKSNLLGECLGHRLVERGLISQAQLAESAERMKAGEGLQGQILIAMQVMDEAAIAAALVEQAQEKLLEIFGWRRGEYEFRPATQLKGGIALPRASSPAVWLMRGVRDRMPIAVIDRSLRRLARCRVSSASAPFYRLQDVELDEIAGSLILQADGRQRVSSWLGGDESTRRALYALIATGLLETQGAGPPRRGARRPAGRPAPTSVDERAIRIELAATAERMRRQNDFEVLGLEPEADVEEVEVAFEKVARGLHPDRHRSHSAAVRSLAEDVFARIQAAYERLRDPRSRGEYLLLLRKGERQAEQAQEQERALEAEMEFQRGEALMRTRRYEAALRRFGNALQSRPQEGEYYAHYGWCLYLNHPDDSAIIEEAIEHVRRGVKLARDHEKPYLFLGRLYKATGDTEAAERMFTRAVQIRPESVEALRELRLINMRRGKQGLIGRIFRR